MQITSLDTKTISGRLRLVFGEIELNDEDIARITARSGQATMFEIRVREVICEFLTANHDAVPITMDISGCTVALIFGTELKRWRFECVAVARYG